jgi:hypothetical protein
MLVMPDDTPAQPYQTSIELASLAPNAEATVYPPARAPAAEVTDDHPKTSAVVALVQLARGFAGEAVDHRARVPRPAITPVVGPEAQQNLSDPVISESYQELGVV